MLFDVWLGESEVFLEFVGWLEFVGCILVSRELLFVLLVFFYFLWGLVELLFFGDGEEDGVMLIFWGGWDLGLLFFLCLIVVCMFFCIFFVFWGIFSLIFDGWNKINIVGK